MKFFLLLLAILLVCYFYACSNNKSDNTTKVKEKKIKDEPVDSNSGLNNYNLNSENPEIIYLPKELKEISGITMTPDGRMFAEQDEIGIIFEVDYKAGKIIKYFSVGNPVLKEDFEDIVFAKNKFYLLNSNGDIYEFEEGENGSSVQYKIHKTGLRKSNDVEGMCYDSDTNSLLLALKGKPGADLEGEKAVYSFSLDSMKMDEKPRFILPLEEIKNVFNPSGIQKNLKTGTFFIIAANGNEIIEVNKGGKILGRHKLPASVHKQPEGIAFDRDFNLYISNEGKSGKGYIVVYPIRN